MKLDRTPPRYYKLIGRLPVPCDDLREFAVWFETADRTVKKTKIGCLEVSTVFLGIDHNFSGGDDPVLFETMIFGDNEEGYQERCSTWDEAERMHEVAVIVAHAWIEKADQLLNNGTT